MRLLVIRPQPGANATSARIKAVGDEVLLMPLFEVQAVDWQVPSPWQFDALLLTSGNAVRAAGEGLDALRELPVFAVGAATSRALLEAQLKPVAIGDSGVDRVLMMAHEAGHRSLLWLAGEDRTTVSTPPGMTLDVSTVYRSVALPAPEDFADKVRSADFILLHSPRAAHHFAALCDAYDIDRAAITLGAYSPNIAESAGCEWKSIVTASAPNDASLLSELRSYFTNIACDP